MVKRLPLCLCFFHVCDSGTCGLTLSWGKTAPSLAMNSGWFNIFCCRKSDKASLLFNRRIFYVKVIMSTFSMPRQLDGLSIRAFDLSFACRPSEYAVINAKASWPDICLRLCTVNLTVSSGMC
ncbi:hypothetical protein TNIN_73961 [Trichonephila inaurata madagascariensis]|uniref:Secreted protein n=1 Tax=Trichonephila inaurata madagascariensis TaxID=2747483 RepID=A0A8X6Y958_9ARAC|nr:hypothetical protein TNIN_73961 [Trichonephila inaurata madagascariensis]